MTPLLSVRDLKVRFPPSRACAPSSSATTIWLDAVCGVSFDIAEGQTFGLVGESGSGKTTLARAIIGLLEPAAGTINFDGEEITGLTRAPPSRCGARWR
jgi:ABC-type oligopeptide transport system ATPase subunit